jgi:DNA invertase Pin-like site-specific DNA recombinase
MTKAGRWLRASSDQQDEQNQLAGIDAYIKASGYEAVKDYEAHDKSASKKEHLPLLREAIADMAAGRIEVLVIRHTDRIDRTEDLGSILREVKEAGGRIESVTEPWLADLSGLGGKVMTSVTEFMNAEYTRKLAVNVRDAQARRRAAGSFASGKAPYGYEISGRHADGSVHPKPGKCVLCYPDRGGMKTFAPNALASAVRRIFSEVASGKSLVEVAKGLTADGIPTWHNSEVWSEKSVRRIVANPAYRGHVQYRGVTYMAVEPLVSAVDWLKANQATEARAKRRGHGGGRPLGAFLKPVCGQCGAPMYRYGVSYRCAGLGPKGNSTQRKGCGCTIKIDFLDAAVLKAFEEYDEPEIIETITPGRDWAEEIAETQLAIKDLDVMADDYDERHATLIKELKRLRALPPEPPRYWAEQTGRTEGMAFRAKAEDEGRAFIRRWKLTVFAPGSEPRWRLDLIGNSYEG